MQVGRIIGLVAALAALASCATQAPPVPPTACAPVAPTPVTVEHAENFTLTEQGGYRVLTVRQPAPGAAPQQFALVPCGVAAPADLPVIETPVRSLFAASTTQLPHLAELGALDLLTGVGTPEYVSGAAARDRIATGQVTAFAESGQIDVERVLTADPDVLLGEGAESQAVPALQAAGVPVLGWADFLESGPLGQAEWIKVMGALTGRDAEAARVYTEIATRYQAAKASVAGAAPTPVLLGQLYQGIWTVPAGGSATGTLVRDAGGTWSEAGNPTLGAVSKDFESVYTADGAAPVWLADGPFPTKAELLAADPRYAELAAVAAGRVWTRDKALGPAGGNEYFERGVTRPDEVLADLVAILHPGPPAEPTYYRQVTG